MVLAVLFQEYGLLFSALVYLAIGIGRALLWAFRAATDDPPPDESSPDPSSP
jgi:hypothetical protein